MSAPSSAKVGYVLRVWSVVTWGAGARASVEAALPVHRSGVSERTVVMSVALALTGTTAGSLDWHCDIGKWGECEVDEVAGGCSLAEEKCDEREPSYTS